MSKTAPVLNLLASVHSHATSCATSPAEPSRLGRTQAFVEHAGEDWQHILAVNLLGTMRVTQAILPRMLRAGRGRIREQVAEPGVPRTVVAGPFAVSDAIGAMRLRSS